MANMVFGTSAYARTRGNLPELPVFNMFVESAPVSETGVVLHSRPGLESVSTVGTGPIRGMYQADGVLGGSLFVVSGNAVYRDGALLGTIDGDAPVSFAADSNELLINAGGTIRRVDEDGYTTVLFPDLAPVSRVAVFAGYFWAIRADTQQIYFSAVLDGASWAALDYESAENDPDPLRDMVVVNDAMILLGSQSVEFFVASGNADAPATPIPQRVFPKGVIAAGCACRFDNTAAWIGPTGPTPPGVRPSLRVYTATQVAQGISDPGIEERLSASNSYALWSFTFEGHEFLVVRLDTHSMLYDAQTQQWCEFGSYGLANWRARCAIGGLFGDDDSGTIWKFGAGYADNGGQLERLFRAGLPMTGGAFTAANVRLNVNMGETTALTGYTANPVLEMRTSRDGGRTWGNWVDASLGSQGQYATRCEFRRVGMFSDPGMLAEFRCTDPVPLRVSSVVVNEASGGRSR